MQKFYLLLLVLSIGLSTYSQTKKTPTSSTIVASIGGKKSGAITKNELLTTGKLELTDGAGTISYTVVIKGVKGTTSTYITPNKFNDDLKAKINKATSGTKITFTKIYSLTKAGVYVYVKPFTLTIK